MVTLWTSQHKATCLQRLYSPSPLGFTLSTAPSHLPHILSRFARVSLGFLAEGGGLPPGSPPMHRGVAFTSPGGSPEASPEAPRTLPGGVPELPRRPRVWEPRPPRGPVPTRGAYLAAPPPRGRGHSASCRPPPGSQPPSAPSSAPSLPARLPACLPCGPPHSPLLPPSLPPAMRSHPGRLPPSPPRHFVPCGDEPQTVPNSA